MSKRGRDVFAGATANVTQKKKGSGAKKNPFKGAVATAAGVARHVTPAFQGAVAQAVIQEKKRNAHFVDLASATYGCDTTGSITLVATIAQGASQSQRVGKKALYKSVQFRGSIYAGASGTVSDVAILLVYDREPTGLLPGITDILNTVNSKSFNNDTNSDRFKIVRRWDAVLTGNSTAPATGNEIQSFDHYVDLRNLPVLFGNLATGAIGDIKMGALYLVTCGSNALGALAPTLECGARTRFIDLE